MGHGGGVCAEVFRDLIERIAKISRLIRARALPPCAKARSIRRFRSLFGGWPLGSCELPSVMRACDVQVEPIPLVYARSRLPKPLPVRCTRSIT